MRIIFMGTPEFAGIILQQILNDYKHEVVAVFTAPPSPMGRGMNEAISHVHQLAINHNVIVHTPKTLRSKKYKEIISTIDADVIIVAAYGIIIPKEILTIKKYGCINVHPSDLPKYRGAAPLQRTIINGDGESAVCIMQMDEGIDTGDVYIKESFDLDHRITFKQLHDICANIGGKLLLQVLANINSIKPRAQIEDDNSYAHKLTKEEGRIHWKVHSSYEIDCKVRAMNPWPGVFFEYNDKIIKILESTYSNSNIQHDHNQSIPGMVLNQKDTLQVICKQGILIITKLQPSGKRQMTASEFIRGTKVLGVVLN